MSTEAAPETAAENASSEGDIIARLEALDAGKPAGDDKPKETQQSAAADDAPDISERLAQQRHQRMLEDARRGTTDEPGESLEDMFSSDVVTGLQALAKRIVGDDEREISAFLKDEIYPALMIEVLGAQEADALDPDIKRDLQVKALNRKVTAERRAREKERAEAEKRHLESEQSAKVQQAKRLLSSWFQENAESFPYLALQARPEEDLFDILSSDEKMTPDRAAKLVNAVYEKDARRYSDLLLGRSSKAEPAAHANGHNDSPSGLTNSGASSSVSVADDLANLDDPDARAEAIANQLMKDPSVFRKRR